MSVYFRVDGAAQPAGSKKAFIDKQGHMRVIDHSGSKGKTWRRIVQRAAREAMGDNEPLQGSLRVVMEFHRARLKSHFGTGRNANVPKAGTLFSYPITRPDVLKLARAVEDALTGIAYADDAQIVAEHLYKFWCPLDRPFDPFVVVRIEPLPDSNPKRFPIQGEAA